MNLSNDTQRDKLIEARKKAVIWHNAEKEKRMLKAASEAEDALNSINPEDRNVRILAFSLLYLGEGLKKRETAMGNSDHLILRFFVDVLIHDFGVERSKLSCELHLRADQNGMELKQYWSKQLGLPIENFKKSSFDRRTVGKATFDRYKGVCVVRCGNVAIQRKLVYLSRKFCEQYISTRA